MYAGGSQYFDEATGQYTGGYVPPKTKGGATGPTYPDGFQGNPVIDDYSPGGDQWSSFNDMINTPKQGGQRGWPAMDPKANPWATAQRAMANQNRQIAQQNNSFRGMGDLAQNHGMINPLAWTAPPAPVAAPVPKDVAPAAPVARTAPVADLPTAVAQAYTSPMPSFTPNPSPIPTNQAEYAASGTPYIKGTLWNQMADPANYVNSSSMERIVRGLRNNQGKIY